MSVALEAVIKDVNASLPERKLVSTIERMDLSADLKALLSDIARVTVTVAGKVLVIGRKILTVLFELVKAFPGIAVGVVAALVVTSLIAAIPLIGAALAAAAKSILLIVGVSVGGLRDLTGDKLAERVDSFVESLKELAKF